MTRQLHGVKRLLFRRGTCQPWRGGPQAVSRLPAAQSAASPGLEGEVNGAAPETPWGLEPGCGHGHRLHLVSASPGSAASGRPSPSLSLQHPAGPGLCVSVRAGGQLLSAARSHLESCPEGPSSSIPGSQRRCRGGRGQPGCARSRVVSSLDFCRPLPGPWVWRQVTQKMRPHLSPSCRCPGPEVFSVNSVHCGRGSWASRSGLRGASK